VTSQRQRDEAGRDLYGRVQELLEANRGRGCGGGLSPMVPGRLEWYADELREAKRNRTWPGSASCRLWPTPCGGHWDCYRPVLAAWRRRCRVTVTRPSSSGIRRASRRRQPDVTGKTRPIVNREFGKMRSVSLQR
jgi:hypothetical protein